MPCSGGRRSNEGRAMGSGREVVIAAAARTPVGRYGLVTICVGVGQGVATIVERVGAQIASVRLRCYDR